VRLDCYLHEKGLSESREKARREILSGWVTLNGETVREPSRTVREGSEVTVKRPGGLFVSRGGEKLRKAVEVFGIECGGFVAADLGASTGGFTDCLLRCGARLVYAIDVGYGQLDWRLRSDPRVVVMERTNVRSLTRKSLAEKPDIVTVDLSFISLLKIVDALFAAFAPVTGIMLIKPQFEAVPGEHKKGVVRKAEAHADILGRVLRGLGERGVKIAGLTHSPIKGPKGNIEFLAHFFCGMEIPDQLDCDISAMIDSSVRDAHNSF
jgi:23S rRNA (cytidine1920-2'-O)/16S rRNA (cytidine1409-2'-O)-methyltransferase